MKSTSLSHVLICLLSTTISLLATPKLMTASDESAVKGMQACYGQCVLPAGGLCHPGTLRASPYNCEPVPVPTGERCEGDGYTEYLGIIKFGDLCISSFNPNRSCQTFLAPGCQSYQIYGCQELENYKIVQGEMVLTSTECEGSYPIGGPRDSGTYDFAYDSQECP